MCCGGGRGGLRTFVGARSVVEFSGECWGVVGWEGVEDGRYVVEGWRGKGGGCIDGDRVYG